MKELNLIMCESDNFELITKVNIDDLNSKSAIIVNESQEALFYKDGQALDLFLSGRHEIKNDSLPIFKRIFSHLFGTNSPLPCNIYFINKVYVLDMAWGTPSAITLEDPKYHLIVDVGANGSMGVRIKDSRKFVVKIVGQMPSSSVDDVKRNIKGVMIAIIKDYIANTIINEKISILDIQTQLLELSDQIQNKINERIIDEWGIELVNFYLNNISARDEDLFKLRQAKEKYLTSMNDLDIDSLRVKKMGEAEASAKLQQGYAEAQILASKGMAQKQVIDALGEANWTKLQSADILKTMAENPNSSGMAESGASFGMGVAMSSVFSNLANQMNQPIQNNQSQTSAPQNEDPIETLKKLKALLDQGLITEEQYKAKQEEVLKRM